MKKNLYLTDFLMLSYPYREVYFRPIAKRQRRRDKKSPCTDERREMLSVKC